MNATVIDCNPVEAATCRLLVVAMRARVRHRVSARVDYMAGINTLFVSVRDANLLKTIRLSAGSEGDALREINSTRADLEALLARYTTETS